MTDFPFDASGRCPACGDPEDDGVLCEACCDIVRNDPRTPARPCQNAEESIAREERKVIENLWSSRYAVTIVDTDWLAEMKISYGDCCGLESNCPPELRIARSCNYCGQPADHLGYCENMRRFMECNPSTPESRLRDDRKFLTDCGIAGDAGPARGQVYIKIEMRREFVQKYKKNRNRKHAGRRRKSAFRPKMGEYAI